MKKLSGFGWLELIAGIAFVVLGIWAFMHPQVAMTGMVLAYGMAAVIMGIADIIMYIQIERYTGLSPVISLISGILSVMSGIMLLVYPAAGALVLTLLFPIWFIAHCISKLTHLPHIRRVAGNGMYAFTLVISIAGLILGFMMLFSPWLTLSTLRYFASAYLVLLGMDGIVMAISPIGRRP